MIIDADCHLSPVALPGGSITADELIPRMDAAGVDQALCWLQPPYTRHLDEANAYIHRAASEHPDRILPFGWADPNLGVPEAIDMARRCVEDYRCHGVKLNGAQNSFYVDDPERAWPVIEAIAETGKMLAFHVGADAFDRTHPFRVAKAAKAFPETNMFMVHMGGVGHQDISAAAIEFATRFENLYLIGSSVRSKAILQAVRTLGPQRVCFGSDTPFDFMKVELARYRALLGDELSAAELADVLGGNVARLLDL
jgi:uncharacterized protein